MPSIDDYCRRAVESLTRVIHKHGFEYLDRDESYAINDDYSLTLVRNLTLKWKRKAPLHFFETGLWSHGAARFEDVSFDATADAARVAFALPCLARSTDKHVTFVVGIVPPLERDGEARVSIKWNWPNWWERLKTDGSYEVEIDLLATRRFRFTLKHAHTLGVNVSSSHPDIAPSKRSEDDYCVCTWTYDNRPADGSYIFSCKKA